MGFIPNMKEIQTLGIKTCLFNFHWSISFRQASSLILCFAEFIWTLWTMNHIYMKIFHILPLCPNYSRSSFIDTMLRKRHDAPLLLSLALLISSTLASSSSTSSWPQNATRRPGRLIPRLSNRGEDYNNEYDDITETTHKPAGTPAPFCQYDLCKDQQESCQKLALRLSCSCPGISGPAEPPEPPTSWSLSLESRGMVVVRWCAPSSTVTHYLVRVGDKGEASEAGENRRMMELGDIAPGTEVCVEAVNRAGVSNRESFSCARFDPSSSETALAVRLVLIGVAVVVVVVLTSALLLWWCKRHQNTPTRTANSGTDMELWGRGNNDEREINWFYWNICVLKKSTLLLFEYWKWFCFVAFYYNY